MLIIQDILLFSSWSRDDVHDDDAADDAGARSCCSPGLLSSLRSVISFFPSFRSPPWHSSMIWIYDMIFVQPASTQSRSQTDAPAETEIDRIASPGKMECRLPNNRNRIQEEKKWKKDQRVNNQLLLRKSWNKLESINTIHFGLGFLKFPKSRRVKDWNASLLYKSRRNQLFQPFFNFGPLLIYANWNVLTPERTPQRVSLKILSDLFLQCFPTRHLFGTCHRKVSLKNCCAKLLSTTPVQHFSSINCSSIHHFFARLYGSVTLFDHASPKHCAKYWSFATKSKYWGETMQSQHHGTMHWSSSPYDPRIDSHKVTRDNKVLRGCKLPQHIPLRSTYHEIERHTQHTHTQWAHSCSCHQKRNLHQGESSQSTATSR